MPVTFEDVKAVLDYCVGDNADWVRIARRHRNPGSGGGDNHLFGWETEQQLLNAKAKGHWLINPDCRGNGRATETNLIRILTDPNGLFGYPRMPDVGTKIDLGSEKCNVLIEWINNLPTSEDSNMSSGYQHGTVDTADADARFLALGDELPPTPALPPGLNFVQAKQVGSVLHVSGMGPQWGSQIIKDGFKGKIWQDLSIEQGYSAARLTGLNLLHVVRNHAGSLSRVEEILEVFGIVNADPGFTQNAKIINGCSDLLVELFGEQNGKHVRTASGSSITPFDIPVYIKMSVVLKTDR